MVCFSAYRCFLVRHQLNAVGQIKSYNQVLLDNVGWYIQFMILDGLGMMYLGWLVARRWWVSRVPAIGFSQPSSTAVLKLLLWTFALLFLLYYMSPRFRGLPSIGQLIQPGGYIAMAGFTYLYLKGDLERGHAVAYFMVYLPVWYVTVLMSSFLTPIILSFILLSVLFFRVRGRVPWAAGVIAAFVVISIYPGSQLYRSIAGSAQTAPTVAERFSQFSQSLMMVYTSSEIRASRWFGFSQRVTAIVPLSIVARKTPGEISYWGGESYRPLLTSWIPRILWPEKPREVAGGTFGHRFQLLPPDDEATSLNLPWLTEAYANFGPWGVVGIMFLIGVFLAFLEKLLAHPGDNAAGWAVGAGVLLPLAFPESNLSVMTGSLLPLIISLWLIFKGVSALCRWRNNPIT